MRRLTATFVTDDTLEVRQRHCKLCAGTQPQQGTRALGVPIPSGYVCIRHRADSGSKWTRRRVGQATHLSCATQIARKASTTYYPTLHLEIARYVSAAGLSGFEIPWSLSRMIGQPPTAMRKHTQPPPSRPKTPTRSAPTTPTKRPPPPGFAGYPAQPLPQPVFPSGYGGSGRPSGERGREQERAPQSRKVTPMFN